MLVRSHDCGVEDQIFEVWIVREGSEDALPDATFAPSVEAYENAVPLGENARQIAPRGARSGDPPHPLDEHSIVRASPARVLRLAHAQILDALPLLVAQN